MVFCAAKIRTISLSQKTKENLLALAWREIALLRTFSLSESRESLLTMPSGELTNEARAETKLACAMPCKEEED